MFFGATLCLLLSQLSHLDDSPLSLSPLPAPLFSLPQSTAVNDSMDTPYRELFWVMYNVLLWVTVWISDVCLLTNSLKQGRGFDNVSSTSTIRTEPGTNGLLGGFFIRHVQTFKVAKICLLKILMGVVITEKKVVQEKKKKRLVTSTPSRYDVRWCS